MRGLVARLALAGGRPVEPGVLVDAIWLEDPPADPAHALHALVSRLRRAVGSAGDVAHVAGGYRLTAVEVAGDLALVLFTPAQAADLLQMRESWLRRRAACRLVPAPGWD